MWGIFVVFLVVMGISAVWKVFEPAERVQWVADLEPSLVQAKQGGRPVMAYFTATWCGPCQSLKRTLWADADVEAALRKRSAVKIDIDAHPELARRYSVEAVPTFILLDSDGNAITRREGTMGKTEFLAWLGG